MLRKLSLLVVVALVSCAPPIVKTTALVPARFHEATKVVEVAVLPFDGHGGREFSAEIEGILANINIGDKQYFTLIERSKIDKVISEQKFSASALVNPTTAANIGKLVGAKGIYTGTITASDSNDSHYKERRTRCAYTVTKRDKKGREYKECAKYEEYYVSCTKRVVNFAFTPKLIEVETARIIYANDISGVASSSACDDSNTPLASAFELMGQAKQFVKERFRKDVAPYYVIVEIELMDSTDGINSKEAKNKFEQGTNFAKNNRLDRACELWGEARILSPNSPSILYNLGICSEVTGELEQSLDLYKKADILLNKPDNRITVALGRVSKAIQDQKKLKEQISK